MQTLVELPPTASPAGGFTQIHGILLHANPRHPAVICLATSGYWCKPGPPGLAESWTGFSLSQSCFSLSQSCSAQDVRHGRQASQEDL